MLSTALVQQLKLCLLGLQGGCSVFIVLIVALCPTADTLSVRPTGWLLRLHRAERGRLPGGLPPTAAHALRAGSLAALCRLRNDRHRHRLYLCLDRSVLHRPVLHEPAWGHAQLHYAVPHMPSVLKPWQGGD